MDFVLFLVIGAVAGYLAGLVMKGKGFGLVGNMIVGIIGGFLGGFLFRQFGASSGSGMTGSLVVSFVGAVVLLLIIGFVKKA